MKTKLLFAVVALFAVSALSAQEARYEIKSGIIKRTIEWGDRQSESVQYFDDYGKIESFSSSFQRDGETSNMLRIVQGKTTTSLFMERKSGSKFTREDEPINYLNLTQAVKDKYKVKEIGDETIAGKPCKKYSIVRIIRDQESPATVWVWKGIVLKTTSTFGEYSSIDIATDIQENVAVDKKYFTIPGDFDIQEGRFGFN